MRVLLYGATGFMGGLIARALARDGARLVLSGRDSGRLSAAAGQLAAGAAVRAAPVHDRRALARAMRDVDLVVACAGPFSAVGEPVLRAAIERGAHYLDIATEQSFLRESYERYEAAARRAGVTAVSGVGCQVGLADLAAHIAFRAAAGRDGAGCDEIAVAYAASGLRPSAGMWRALVESLAGPAVEWSGDRWDPVAPGGERRTFNVGGHGDDRRDRSAVAFPSGEVITIPRHVTAGRVQTYLTVGGGGALGAWVARSSRLFGPTLSLFLRSQLATQARSLAGARSARPSPAERAGGRFAVAVTARRGFDHEQVLVTGRDPYQVAAELVAWAAGRLAAGDGILAGVRAPAEVFDPRAALDALASRGIIEIATSSAPAPAAPGR